MAPAVTELAITNRCRQATEVRAPAEFRWQEGKLQRQFVGAETRPTPGWANGSEFAPRARAPTARLERIRAASSARLGSEPLRSSWRCPHPAKLGVAALQQRHREPTQFGRSPAAGSSHGSTGPAR